MTDAELVRQALAGTTAAYEQLVRRWSTRVMAVCHARVARSEAAEDLAQETLLRGLRALPTLADPAKFGPWLCGIAQRACLDWLKSAHRTEVSISALHDEDSDRVEDPAGENELDRDPEHRDELGRLVREVERLPLPYREVLMHYYYDDCTYQELADLLDVSPATVNARLTKARQMLRERLGAKKSPESGTRS